MTTCPLQSVRDRLDPTDVFPLFTLLEPYHVIRLLDLGMTTTDTDSVASAARLHAAIAACLTVAVHPSLALVLPDPIRRAIVNLITIDTTPCGPMYRLLTLLGVDTVIHLQPDLRPYDDETVPPDVTAGIINLLSLAANDPTGGAAPWRDTPVTAVLTSIPAAIRPPDPPDPPAATGKPAVWRWAITGWNTSDPDHGPSDT